MEKPLSAKDVKKDINKIRKNFPIDDNSSKIERVTLQKEAIREYYDNNISRIGDNDLVKIYNRIIDMNIFIAIPIGIISGVCANTIGEICDLKFSYTEEIAIDLIQYIFLQLLFPIASCIAIAFLIFWSYRQITSLYSYTHEVDIYYKEILGKYIKSREDNYKAAATGSNNKENDLKEQENDCQKRVCKVLVHKVSKNRIKKKTIQKRGK